MIFPQNLQAARQFSTETVDNFVDNLALCVGDAVQSELSANCRRIGQQILCEIQRFH
jgi:hypothetical protein